MTNQSLTNYIPAYEAAREFLRILQGSRYSIYVSMMNDIMAQIGSQSSQVNWKKPDEWIPGRLEGRSKDLALKLWKESGGLVNPRHSQDIRTFAKNRQLAQFTDGTIQLTDKGNQFVYREGDLEDEIDEIEGLQFVLSEIAEKGPCKLLDLLDSFVNFCQMHSTWNSVSSINHGLSARVRHLKERFLIERVGHSYQITDIGLKHLRQLASDGSVGEASPGLRDLAKKINDRARKDLEEYVQEMDPYAFEHLVKRLLEAMDYEDVEVTKQSNDKGVDVVGDIELGISRVREVIQVKRQRVNVGRPVLDSLRGSLYRFDAVRGTIITTGGFAKTARDAAFDKGAPPITLIDGQKLLDLLIENEIGIHRKEVTYLEFDAGDLSRLETDEYLNEIELPQT